MLHRIFRYLQLAAFVLIVITSIYFLKNSALAQHYFSNPEALRETLLGLGMIAPLAVILMQTFQTTISIIPSQITTIAAGFVFGPFWGLLYSLIGAVLGSQFIFWLSRKYGKSLAMHWFSEKELLHFKFFFRQKKLWALFLARMGPLFPNDLVSFAAGMTNIKGKQFALVSTSAFLVQMIILTYFGSTLSSGKISWPLLLITLLVSLMFMSFLFKSQIKRIIIKDLHRLEKEEKIVEKGILKEL